MSVVGSRPVCLPVIQLVKEALLNRCTVPGYYRAIHACHDRNSQVLSSELAGTYQFTAGNDKGILLDKHSFSLSNLATGFSLFFFEKSGLQFRERERASLDKHSLHVSDMFPASVACTSSAK